MSQPTVALKGPNMDGNYNVFIIEGNSVQAVSISREALVEMHTVITPLAESIKQLCPSLEIKSVGLIRGGTES